MTTYSYKDCTAHCTLYIFKRKIFLVVPQVPQVPQPPAMVGEPGRPRLSPWQTVVARRHPAPSHHLNMPATNKVCLEH